MPQRSVENPAFLVVNRQSHREVSVFYARVGSGQDLDRDGAVFVVVVQFIVGLKVGHSLGDGAVVIDDFDGEGPALVVVELLRTAHDVVILRPIRKGVVSPMGCDQALAFAQEL